MRIRTYLPTRVDSKEFYAVITLSDVKSILPITECPVPKTRSVWVEGPEIK